MTKRAQEATRRATHQRSVFYRWVWLVYAPLVAGLVAVVVLLMGAMPGFLALPFLLLVAWDAAAGWLLVERHRRKVRLKVPTGAMVGVGGTAGAVVAGTILAWMGVDRLSSGSGPPMLILGGFLVLTAALAPAFKLVDLTLRLAGRTMLRMGDHVDRRRPQPERRSGSRTREAA